jgi:hypothetical protein
MPGTGKDAVFRQLPRGKRIALVRTPVVDRMDHSLHQEQDDLLLSMLNDDWLELEIFEGSGPYHLVPSRLCVSVLRNHH